MKQIKDVEMLKDEVRDQYAIALGEYHEDARGCFHATEAEIINIIDSLAVEVPEPKHGWILKYLDRMKGISIWCPVENKAVDIMNKEARAELTQLQAENTDRKKTIDEILVLNRSLNDELVERDDELRHHKGALRTLAKLSTDCEYCYALDITDNNCMINRTTGNGEICVARRIAYALANPTEEVEG